MVSQFSLATWNIGGGILGESHQRDGIAEIDYYANVIDQHNPDLICLQETHEFISGEIGQTETIAKSCDYPFFIATPISPSHLNTNAQLALGLISRFPIEDHQYYQFPNPGLAAQGPNGDSWLLFDKGFTVSTINIHGRPMTIINAHCFPFHYFGASAAETRFGPIWQILSDALIKAARDSAAVAAIDLNFPSVPVLMPGVLDSGVFQSAFNTPTTPHGIQQDHVLFGQSYGLQGSKCLPTKSDHFYCHVSLSFK